MSASPLSVDGVVLFSGTRRRVGRGGCHRKEGRSIASTWTATSDTNRFLGIARPPAPAWPANTSTSTDDGPVYSILHPGPYSSYCNRNIIANFDPRGAMALTPPAEFFYTLGTAVFRGKIHVLRRRK